MFSVPAPVDLVFYILRQTYGYTSTISNRRKRATDAGVAEELFDYGCWCTSLDPSVSPLYGMPIDSIDWECRNLRKCGMCSQGGTCDTQSAFQIDYDSVSDSYSCGSNAAGSCAESICNCQLSFAETVAELINANNGEVDSANRGITDDGLTCVRASGGNGLGWPANC